MISLRALLILFVATFIPGLELRFSIPLGWFREDLFMSVGGRAGVVVLCLIANILLGMLLFEVMPFIEKYCRKVAWFERVIWPRLTKAREKLRPSVEKYGVWGVAVFIGVPLPGTGAYTGAVGAYLLGLDKQKFHAANFLGVFIAAVAVTAICYALSAGFIDDGSFIRKLFLKN